MSVIFYTWNDGEKREWGEVAGGEAIEEHQEGFEEWVESEKDMPTTPDFEDEDALTRVYEGPFIVTEYGDDEEKAKPRELMKMEETIVQSMDENNVSFKEIHESISAAYDNTVWWAYGKKDPDLSKSPGMWSQSNPSKEAKEWIEAALEHNAVHGEYVGLPRLAPINIERMFRRRINRDEGFRVEDVVDDLQDLFPSLSEERALNIARTETSAVLDTAKDLAHDAEMAEIEEEADSPEEVDEQEPKYKWVGPNDDSTTEICSEVGRITDEKGGVSLDKLQNLLQQHAQKSKNGTPSRVDEWTPHYQCRRTFERVN